MTTVKSHLDFTSWNRPGPCFRDLNYTPYDVNITKSRRQHLAAYLKFMRPEVSNMFNDYADRGTEMACQWLYEERKACAVSTPFFEYLADNCLWRLWFKPFGDDGPKWPWGPPKASLNLTKGQKPNQIYAKYRQDRADKLATRAANALRISSIAESAPETPIYPNSEYIVRSQAVLTTSGDDEPEPDLELNKRQAAWDELDFRHIPGVVGPFEIDIPSMAPMETLVARDLVAVNELTEGHAIIKANMTQRRVIVSFPDKVEEYGEDG
ncbi:hypothetical protein NXS19_002697 [Fusarium pseudograminearum]|nr:hypothetical protein NXS19_002697 [Fusarium pseudograminearum]